MAKKADKSEEADAPEAEDGKVPEANEAEEAEGTEEEEDGDEAEEEPPAPKKVKKGSTRSRDRIDEKRKEKPKVAKDDGWITHPLKRKLALTGTTVVENVDKPKKLPKGVKAKDVLAATIRENAAGKKLAVIVTTSGKKHVREM